MLTDLERHQQSRMHLMAALSRNFKDYKGSFYLFNSSGKRVGYATSGGNSHTRRKAKREMFRKGFEIVVAYTSWKVT